MPTKPVKPNTGGGSQNNGGGSQNNGGGQNIGGGSSTNPNPPDDSTPAPETPKVPEGITQMLGLSGSNYNGLTYEQRKKDAGYIAIN